MGGHKPRKYIILLRRWGIRICRRKRGIREDRTTDLRHRRELVSCHINMRCTRWFREGVRMKRQLKGKRFGIIIAYMIIDIELGMAML